MSGAFQSVEKVGPKRQIPCLRDETLKEIEVSLLNALVGSDEDFSEVEALGLHAEDFSTETHRLVFEAMKRLHGRGEPTDALMLDNELKGTPRPDGGAWSVYIMNVLGVALPLENLDYRVGKIREASRLRKLAEAGYRLHEAARKGDSEDAGEWGERIAELQSHGETDTGAVSEPNPEVEYPDILNEAAFHGLAGEIVRAVEPNSEADPIALLSSLLTGFGNIIGDGAYFAVGRERHYLKLFIALVGDSAKGRKGTSWSPIRSLFGAVDPHWTESRVVSGLSSGEGVIYHLRDPIYKTEVDKKTGAVNEVLADAGESDKRLFILEGELAQPLKLLRREGNILSPVLRNAWDSGDLRTLTKNTPLQASGAHVSIIGHITKQELVRGLSEVETGNGFANRFLWLCVRRSKVLPFGGDFDSAVFEPLENKLREAVEFASQAGQLTWAAATRPLWESVYPDLSEGRPGLVGAITARAEAQVTRLACLYALLDRSKEIEPEHLRAALSLWDYCEASTRYIFQKSAGGPLANKILKALTKRPDGMTRTEVNNLLGGNYLAPQIQEALDGLRGTGLVSTETAKTGGRPSERWCLVKTVTEKTE